MRKMYAVLVKASRIVVLDHDSESEAMKLAMQEVEFDSFHNDEAEIEQSALKPEEVDSYIRHGAQDLREKP